MNRHDHWFGAILNPSQQRMQIRTAGSRIPGGLFQLLDIGPGDEGPAAADHHDRANRTVAFGCIESRENTFGHARTQRVHRRIVESDYGDAVSGGESYGLAHRKSVTLS